MRINKRKPDQIGISYYIKSYIDILSKNITFDSKTKLLEIGCGTGHFTYHFSKLCTVYGIDKNIEAIKSNPVKNISVMDCMDLKFEDNSFDIVFCHNVLHHVASVEKAVAEMKRVSKSYVIIIEPNRCNPINFITAIICKEERNILKLSVRYWKNVMQIYNLSIISIFTFGMPIPNRLPTLLLPFFKLFHKKSPIGWDNFMIARSDR